MSHHVPLDWCHNTPHHLVLYATRPGVTEHFNIPLPTDKSFLIKICLESLEEVNASSNDQTPMQYYKNHKELGKHDSTKGIQ